MTRKQERLGLLALGMAALGGATVLVLSAFNDNLVFFYSPTELKAKAVTPDRRVRIGGPRIDVSMLAPLMIMALGFTLLFIVLLILRMRTALNERKAMALRLNAGAAPAPRRPRERGVSAHTAVP